MVLALRTRNESRLGRIRRRVANGGQLHHSTLLSVHFIAVITNESQHSRLPLARSQPPLAIGGEVVLSARLGGRVSLFEGTSSPSSLNPTPLCLGGDASRVPGHGLLELILICPLCLMLTFSRLSGFLELAVPQPSQAGACKLAHIRSSVRL